MRRIRLIPALLVFLFSACNENLIDTQLSDEKGEVVFDLSADERVEIVSTRSEAESNLPSLDDFRIEHGPNILTIVESDNALVYTNHICS